MQPCTPPKPRDETMRSVYICNKILYDEINVRIRQHKQLPRVSNGWSPKCDRLK